MAKLLMDSSDTGMINKIKMFHASNGRDRFDLFQNTCSNGHVDGGNSR